MPRVDVHTYIGAYPWRHLPHPEPGVLVRVLEREGIDHAWVGHLPSAFHRSPAHGNAELYAAIAPHRDRLSPAPAIRPDWPDADGELARAVSEGAAAVRLYPMQWGLAAGDRATLVFAERCSRQGLPVVLTVRFEDNRQRHPLDVAGDLSAAHIRAMARARTGARLVVLGAGRELIQEVHWGLTPEERTSVWWDISWIWGPPEDDLALLFRTIGADRLLFGSAWPLRLAQTPRANLALLPDDLAHVALGDPLVW